MERALQAILVKYETDKQAILAARQETIIIFGHIEYTPGPVLIGCPLDNWCIMRDIVVVTYCTLKWLNEPEYADSGYGSRTEMFMELKDIYPTITWESPVTVIRWV